VLTTKTYSKHFRHSESTAATGYFGHTRCCHVFIAIDDGCSDN